MIITCLFTVTESQLVPKISLDHGKQQTGLETVYEDRVN